MIPFFVVDRPASLEILKGLFFKYPNLKFGLMTHINVSPKFTELYKSFPYKTPLKYFDDEINEKKLNRIVKKNIIKISDSGAFQKNGDLLPYKILFQKYVSLGVHYGIINDVLHDKDQTLKSAEEAIIVYEESFKGKFKLLGVAQGKTIDEYVECYQILLDLGYKYIAIGGLLKRNGNSNYVRVRNEKLLINVVKTIQEEFKPKNLFTLGVYHPKRHKLLEELRVWGADYKGWLFSYDEFYRNSMKYLEDTGKINKNIKNTYQKFLKYKLNYLNKKTSNSREKYWKARKKLDEELRKIGLSLQELRYREIRESLEKNIISQMNH